MELSMMKDIYGQIKLPFQGALPFHDKLKALP